MLFRSIAVALLSVCLSLPAFSQQPPASSSTPTPRQGHGMGMEMGMGHLRMPSDERIDRSLNILQKSLKLNPTQVSSIRQLAQKRRESLQSAREQSRPKFEQLMSMLKEPNPDPATVGRTVIELKKIHEQARTKQSDFENQLSSILNPSQRETVEYLRNHGPTTMALRSLGLLGSPDQQEMFGRESE